MAKCNYCGTTILFGGTRDEDHRYCNDKCHSNGQLALISEQVPLAVLKEAVQTTHSGNCPKCQGRGPVDVHTSHRIWSALLLTSWTSRPQICCRFCGIKSKIGDLFFSLFLGWWGFPWGIIVTPVQIGRNFFGMFIAPSPQTPSPLLEELVKINLAAAAAQHVATTSSNQTTPPPPPSQG